MEYRNFSPMLTLNIKVIPNASKSEIVGWLGSELKVKVSAQPEKGKANKAIIQLLAKELGLSKKDIRIESGTTSSLKTLQIEGLSNEQLQLTINNLINS